MTKTKNKTVKEKSNFSLLSIMQNIGKSLVFPIATLPAAALLLRLGAFVGTYGVIDGSMVEQIAYWVGFIMQTPGAAVFDNMPLIFGIGVAFGFAKENRGEVALVGAIAYFALIGLAQNENSLSTLLYGQVNLGNASLNADGSVLHSDLLYLNIFSKDGKEVLSSSWLMNFGVFGGILTGLLSASLYNKFSDVRLHPALGFFSGRRFVPIVTLFSMIVVSLIMAAIWPWINIGLIQLSILVSELPYVGAGVYGFINRLLIPFGLHQVLNTYFWFQSPIVTQHGENLMVLQEGVFVPILGDITGFSLAIDGTVFQWIDNTGATIQGMLHTNGLGDSAYMTSVAVNAGVATDNGTVIPGGIDVLRGTNMGMYQAGFFPTMMFGLPAVAIAMAVKSEKEHKKAVWAFMLAGSLVAFLTGITEPLEFSFMFISPVIYFVYSALTGIYAMVVVYLHISVGFGFSAGLIDWILSILSGGVGTLSGGKEIIPGGSWANIELLAIGIAAAIINFTIVWFLIGTFKIATPGRRGNVAGLTHNVNSGKGKVKAAKDEKWTKMAMDTIDFIGKENIENIDNCITRLRLTVKNNSKYSDSGIVAIGYTGVVKVGKKAYQAIIGPEAEIIANEMRRLLSEGYGDKSKKPVSNSLKKEEIGKKEVVKNEPKPKKTKEVVKKESESNETENERFNRLYDEFEERANKRNS